VSYPALPLIFCGEQQDIIHTIELDAGKRKISVENALRIQLVIIAICANKPGAMPFCILIQLPTTKILT